MTAQPPKVTAPETESRSAKQLVKDVLFRYHPKGEENFNVATRTFLPKINGKFKGITLKRGVSTMPIAEWEALQNEPSFMLLIETKEILKLADGAQLLEAYEVGKLTINNVVEIVQTTQRKNLLQLWQRWIIRKNDESHQQILATIRSQLSKIDSGESKPYLPSNDWADLPKDTDESSGIKGSLDELY